MDTQHLAIASVPMQSWNGRLYEKDQALRIGTIFPELNLPFFAAESLPGEKVPAAAGWSEAAEAGREPFSFKASGSKSFEKKTQQQAREALMAQISAVSFVLDDLVLFLDTHAEQQEAIALRKQLIEERKRLLKEYDESYYSLTKDCEGPWTEGPMPWEGACV